MMDLSGKKLLLVGGMDVTYDLIMLAHRNHVFIGVADYNKGTRVKKAADIAHDINILDEDAVIKLYRDEKYDGLISNFSDMLSPYVTRIADAVGANVPYTIEQLRMSTDKKYFKDKCNEYGVSVPKEYIVDINNPETLNEIDYPVIVKPIDGSGSRGITVCNTVEELIAGYNKAMQTSRSNEVIIEQFIPHDEINVTYIAQDGDIQLVAIHDRYFNIEQDSTVKVPDMYIYPSRYTEVYIDKYNDKVMQMLRGLGIKNGSLFMQACVKDDEVFFYEAGMRLNGCKTYDILEVENDFNSFERLMCFALTGSMGEYRKFNPRFKKWYATWNVVGKPGAVVDRFVGLDELRSYPWLIQTAIRYCEGDRIPENSKGTLLQLIGRIHIYGETKEQLLERINIIQTIFHAYDAQGNEIILTPHDVNDLRNHIDYELTV